jgi:hypothetical protein
MPSLRHIAWAALAGIMLAGCGGGGIASTVPSGPSAAASAREPQRIAPAVTGTLYVADHWGVAAYDINANDPASPLRSFVPHAKKVNSELIQGLATAPDGMLAVLQNQTVNKVQNCRTVIYPANAGPAVPPQGTYLCDPATAGTQGQTIARGAAGFDLVYRSGDLVSTYFIEHLAETGAISSTMALPRGIYDGVAATAGGGNYAGAINGTVLRYAAGATNGALTMGSFTVPGGNIHAIATAPDHTLYVATGAFGNESIYAFAKGATTPSRTLGPFTTNYVTVMTVDAQNLLYVGMSATTYNTGVNNEVRVYAADATGTANPVRRISNAMPNFEIWGLAVAQP